MSFIDNLVANAVAQPQAICSCCSSLPSYICLSCWNLFCNNCAKLVGLPSACLCKACGSLCSDYQAFLHKQIVHADKTAPFGVEDFKSALYFPLQDFSTNLGLALVYGALLYSVPYLAFSGIGLFFGMLGVLPALIANSFMFGFNSRVINSVETGRLASKTLFDTSEMLADLGETVAISCGILFITIVPFSISLWFAPSVVSWLVLGWMIFYYPLALMTAASTNSFWAIINPLNGFGEIQAHKSTYPMFFFFYVIICALVGGLVVTVLVNLVQSLAGSPILVLLPIFIVLMMVLGSLVFYSNLTISYLIGRMKFKTSY